MSWINKFKQNHSIDQLEQVRTMVDNVCNSYSDGEDQSKETDPYKFSRTKIKEDGYDAYTQTLRAVKEQ